MTFDKDWGGNKTTAFTALGASNHTARDRAERDLYTTNQLDFVRFLKALKRDGLALTPPVWECAAGLGHLVEVLERINLEVVATDIEDRTDWDKFKKIKTQLKKLDFLDAMRIDVWDFNTILTNPPYSEAESFVEQGMSLLKDGQQLILLLRIQWLESQARYKLFQKWPYKYVYVYVKRAGCDHNGNEEGKASAMCYAWFIYEKGFKGEPVVRFIP
jgi:hypothetical protein